MEYLSSLFSKSIVPYQLRDNNKLIQPLKRTTTFGIKSFAYYRFLDDERKDAYYPAEEKRLSWPQVLILNKAVDYLRELKLKDKKLMLDMALEKSRKLYLLERIQELIRSPSIEK